MIKLTIGVAAAVLLAVAPAMAKEKTTKHMKSDLSQEQSEMLKTEGQNREPGENGTFQGKPVVEGPANWKSAHTGSSASSGSSSGDAGAASDSRD